MKSKLTQNGITVKKSALHGYGVFAERVFKKGEKIEECCIFFTEEVSGLLNYCFKVEDKIALLSGQGSLYNHSNDPNVNYYFDLERNLAVFEAIDKIYPGVELLIDYGETWFSDRNMKVKKISRWKQWLYPKYSLLMRAIIACGTVFAITKLFIYFGIAK